MDDAIMRYGIVWQICNILAVKEQNIDQPRASLSLPI